MKLIRFLPTVLMLAVMPAAAGAQSNQQLAQQVTIRRTEYGVPHLLADNYKALGFGLGYAQVEDYGARVVNGLMGVRGQRGLIFGRDSIDDDFLNRLAHRRTVATYHLIDPDVRQVLEGFAAGVNYYVELHRSEFPGWLQANFTGHDVAAIAFGGGTSVSAALRLIRRQSEPPNAAAAAGNEGSNAWAFAPSRTKSGRAILLRNPHLNWNAGYWEAHVTIPGELNFYGDFRLGGPFTIIGGFNEHLGWATTNNNVDTDEVYALAVDPDRPDHYLFDGISIPLQRELLTAEYRNGPGINTMTREFWTTPLGPVVDRVNGKIYVLRAAGEGEYRNGDQFLYMMRARNLEEWKQAMRIRSRTTSNFTYADRAGNIFYIWNGSQPDFPPNSGGDSIPVPAHTSAEVWRQLVPFDRLPQLHNPKGGYIHQENDPFHYTNLNAVFDSTLYPPPFPRPQLRLRSQHALQLVHGSKKVSLEDVVAMKHSYRMLLADRVKPALLAALAAAQLDADARGAAEVLRRWDNRAAHDSRGALLFQTWWQRYAMRLPQDSLYEEVWTPKSPTTTPRGLKNPQRAVEAFLWAVPETRRLYGAIDAPWGEFMRVRRGSVDVPVGGCSGAMGCFRVLNFEQQPDGKYAVNGGDGWVLAVEFGNVPRAYSVLGYGQSSRPESPHFSDQAAMFAAGQMKKVPFTEADIRKTTIRTYHPGQ
ncbi:MAG TPA: penicillin acylase family protein [Burkholderiales bacterium]|nr:penicillin acylase family protein [Burkholderiales bacterium]